VVIGGGNLFADADLNFPIKIHGALAEAASRRLPVGIYGVGVTDNWSQRGRQLFRDGVAQSELVYAAVRDARSQAIWQKQFDGLAAPPPALCRDPGLLAAKHFPAVAKRTTGRHIGICVTNPVALRYHAAPHLQFTNIDAWFLDLSRAMAARGWTVTLFSNGSPEDVAYLARVQAQIATGQNLIGVAPHFATPADLAAFVSTCDVLVAHRMHACIAAYSYGIPHIGLAWDVKLDSFFESTGRSAYMVDPMSLPTADAAALAERAFEEGIPARQHAAVLDECSRDVARLLDGLRSATAERPGQAQAS
jgi:polysaccharide pyruvyl transferase WcaK-like protein